MTWLLSGDRWEEEQHKRNQQSIYGMKPAEMITRMVTVACTFFTYWYGTHNFQMNGNIG